VILERNSIFIAAKRLLIVAVTRAVTRLMASTSVTPLSGTFIGLFHACHNAFTGHTHGFVTKHR